MIHTIQHLEDYRRFPSLHCHNRPKTLGFEVDEKCFRGASRSFGDVRVLWRLLSLRDLDSEYPGHPTKDNDTQVGE